MGKNDIWIASSAIEIEGVIITMDKDFQHLDEVLCKVHYIDIGLVNNSSEKNE